MEKLLKIVNEVSDHLLLYGLILSSVYLLQYLNRGSIYIPEELKPSVSTFCCVLIVKGIASGMYVNTTMFKKPLEIQEVKQIPGNDTCFICLEDEIHLMVLNPCGHTFCNLCSSKMNKCPMCQKQIISAIKLFKI